MAKLYLIEETGKTLPQPVANHTRLAFPFEKFNALQSRFALEGLHTKDCNVICTWKTGTGKTVCAYLVCEAAMRRNKKIVYACPLKSLAEEKVRELRKLFPARNVEVFTGDYTDIEARRERALRADIAVVTTELLDSVSRTRLVSDVLLKNCMAIISDEAHIIATDRGPSLEGALVRISTANPAVRHVLLSATVPNGKELGSWIMALNGKDTYVLTSSWTPVSLKWHIVEVKPRKPRKEWRREAINRASLLVRMLLSSEPESRILLFVWTKGEGRLICERLAKEGFRCAFHNAELELDDRLSLEEGFDDGSIQVLVSTTTLAWGRNTNARHVILFGEKRGLEDVDGWDILQAGGRAGRPGRVDKGDVWFIVADAEHAASLIKEPPEITSRLVETSPLAFQLLGEIPIKGEITADKLFRWYKKTFAFRCIRDEDPLDLLIDALDLLERCGCAVTDSRGVVRLTNVGVVARRFYVKPEEIHCLCRVLMKIKEIPDSEEACDLLSILFTAHSASQTKSLYLTIEERAELESTYVEEWRKKHRGLILGDVHAYVAYSVKSWHFFNSQNPPQPVPFKAREFVYDMERISEVCICLAREVFSLPEDTIKAMKKTSVILRYGAPYEAGELLEIRGIGTKRAVELLKLGIRTKKQLIDSVKGKMRDRVLKVVPLSVLKPLLEEEEPIVESAFSF